MQASPDSNAALIGTLEEITTREAAFRLQTAKDFIDFHKRSASQTQEIHSLKATLVERDTYVHQLHLQRVEISTEIERLRADVTKLTLTAQTLVSERDYHAEEHKKSAAAFVSARNEADRIASALSEEEATRRLLAEEHATLLHLNGVLNEQVQKLQIETEAFARRLDRSEAETAAKATQLRGIHGSLAWFLLKPLVKLQQLFNPVVTQSVPQALPDGGLSYFLHTSLFQTFSDDQFEVRGWVFSKQGKKIDAIRARIDAATISGTYHLDDPAARMELSGASANPNAGFSILLPLPRGKSRVFIEALIENEGWRAIVDAPVWRT